MRLIITRSMQKMELFPFGKIFSLKIIKKAAKKALKGAGKNIKSSTKLPKTQLKKVNLTSPSSAGRAVFLLIIDSKTTVLVILRAKNDKKIGVNMTINNPHFKKLLKKNIDLILEDLDRGAYKEYGLL